MCIFQPITLHRTPNSPKSRNKIRLTFHFVERKKIYIVKSSQFVSPVMFYGHAMCFHLQRPNRSKIFIFSGLSLSRRSNSGKLTRLKIAADNLIVFAGEFFTDEIEDTESL